MTDDITRQVGAAEADDSEADTPASSADAGSNGASDASPPGGTNGTIAGTSVLKGLLLYAAIASFAGLYGYFMAKILGAAPKHPPNLDGALVTAAAALAGVLGSAFALEIGTPTSPSATNQKLKAALDDAETVRDNVAARLRLVFSLEPMGTDSASWPKTIGIWAYAVVGSAVAITYVTNQSETPDTVKALAVAFAGYVLALIRSAYNNAS